MPSFSICILPRLEFLIFAPATGSGLWLWPGRRRGGLLGWCCRSLAFGSHRCHSTVATNFTHSLLHLFHMTSICVYTMFQSDALMQKLLLLATKEVLSAKVGYSQVQTLTFEDPFSGKFFISEWLLSFLLCHEGKTHFFKCYPFKNLF